jgi:hypothetical protein
LFGVRSKSLEEEGKHYINLAQIDFSEWSRWPDSIKMFTALEYRQADYESVFAWLGLPTSREL